MPYKNPSDLPESVKSVLPKHAREQYRDAGDRQGDSSREETAHKVAWSAVKQKYKKDGDKWKPEDQ